MIQEAEVSMWVLTFSWWIKSLRFLQKAVRRLQGNDIIPCGVLPVRILSLDLIEQRLKPLWHDDKIIQDMSQAHRAGMNNRHTGNPKQTLCKIMRVRLILCLCKVHHPLKEIIGFLIVRITRSLHFLALFNKWTEKLVFDIVQLAIQTSAARKDASDDGVKETG